jgi:VWFA-related protein
MRTPSSIVATAAALFFCGGPLLSGQQAPPEKPAFRSGIELVTIDVGVIDRQGRPLRGLGPADFVVTVAGQPRRVVSAEFVDGAAAQSGDVSRPDVVPVSTNEGGGGGRLFVFIVDQSRLEPGNARNVAHAASRFLARLTLADRSALMLIPTGPSVAFTWAHDRVRDALLRVSGLGSTLTSWNFGSLTEARDIANRNSFALRTVSERECRSSGFASGLGTGSTGPSSGGTAPGSGTTPPPGSGPPPGGGTGGTGTGSTGGGNTTGAGSRSSGGGIGDTFGSDACTRDLQMQADMAWREAQATSLSSLAALRHMLAALRSVPGDKTVILVSGGWPLDMREEHSVLSTVAADAAAARATLYTFFVPASMFSADRRMISSTPMRDADLHLSPLETLAGMTGGGSFRTEVGAEGAFERLGRELSGYYRIGVEKDPTDLDGKTRPMKVHVSRNAVTVRAREVFDTRTYEDRDWSARLASALEAPAPATSLGLRVTSYLASDPDDGARIRLVLAGEASRLQPGEATLQALVRDLEGKRILAGEQPIGEPTGDRLPFMTNIAVPPGSYIVRLAVMDGTGRVGSVDHRVEARPVPLGALTATGPVLVRVPSGPVAEPRFALDGVRQDERLALEVGLEGDRERLANAEVVFEIAERRARRACEEAERGVGAPRATEPGCGAEPHVKDDGPALVHTSASLSPGARDGSAVAQAVADMRVLPPGPYVVRAKVRSGSDPPGEMRRAFAVTEAPRVLAEATSASTPVVGRGTPPAARARLGTAAPFALDQVLAPPILGAFLDRVAARPDAASPAMRELIERARTAGIRELAVSDAVAAEAPVAAFLRGLTLLAQKKLDPAANAFRRAMRTSADFYPAMVYLGACYAAGGNDKEAAGAWRTALIKEGDAVALHLLLADALLRQGHGELALQALDRARARWPEDDGLTRRFVVAALQAGKHADGLRAVDDLIEKRAEDEPTLAIALRMLYEAFVNGQPVEGVEQDRARMIRLAEVYRERGGPSLALIDVWVAAATRKPSQ